MRGANVRANPFYAVASVLNGSFEERTTDKRKMDSMLGALGWAQDAAG